MKQIATLAACAFMLGSSGAAMAECTSPNCASEPPNYNNSTGDYGTRRQARSSSHEHGIVVDSGFVRSRRTNEDAIDRAMRQLGLSD
jgi:hypothetical protein